MAINMMCMKSNCKNYYEDCCTRNINEERIVIDENGQCETFEEGKSDWYDCEKTCTEKGCEECKKEFSSDI